MSTPPTLDTPAPGVTLDGLSQSQATIARTLGAPLFVEAGAGSGKTFTLTQRIAWALSPGSGPDGAPFLDSLDQVLVITFTRAAAREICERTRATLRRAGMAEQALRVDDAWISTIHGMCARILRRHALDLGLDPAFQVVSDSQEAELYGLAMERVMAEVREEEASAPLIEEYGLGSRSARSGRGKEYTGLMAQVDGLVRAARALPGGLSQLSWATPDEAHAEMCEAMDALVMRYEELCGVRLTDAARKVAEPSLRALRAWDALPPGTRTPEAACATLGEVGLPRSSKALAEVLPPAREAYHLAVAEAELARVAGFAPQLVGIARRVGEAYDALKREAGALDNDDLVRLALAAVRDNDVVRASLAGRFRLVMVDEFQDTDSLQLELVELLAGGPKGLLCTVGDAQQSIYRFRGADVGVFRRRGAAVGEGSHVRLARNFRSHADVLALVERVGAGSPATGPGVMRDFMCLDACPTRRDAYRAQGLPRVRVEVAAGLGPNGYTAPTDDVTLVLAAQVADALAAYRDAGERPGGMALLLGRTTRAGLYVDAIRARGMECVVSGGSGFAASGEAAVVAALLHTLANPADTRSGLFPTLASELFGLDANDFVELGTRHQDVLDAPSKRTVDKGLASMELYGGATPSARLRLAHDVLSRALSDVGHRPVADVLDDVVRDSGWLARLEAQGVAGRASAANVVAALRHVRDLTEGMGLGAVRAADEFDRWLDVAKAAPGSLAGGLGDTGEGTVQVMTIHASKGLEFPVVAVAECWGNPQADDGPSLAEVPGGRRYVAPAKPKDSKASGALSKALAALAADSDACADATDDLEAGRPVPLALTLACAREGSKAAEAEERTRLLYVAMTRAREALVLAVDANTTKGSGKGNPSHMKSDLARGVLHALTGSEGPVEPGVRDLDYGGSAPALLRAVGVWRAKDEKGTHVGPAEVVPPLGQAHLDESGILVRPGSAGTGASDGRDGAGPSVGDAGAVEAPFALFAPEGPCAVPAMTWRAREGVYSYSSAHAALEAERAAGAGTLAAGAPVAVPASGGIGLPAGASPAVPVAIATGATTAHEPSSSSKAGARPASPRPTRAELEAEAEGAPGASDPDRATNLGSAFHELAQVMVESGADWPGEGRIAHQVAQWGLSPRAERRLREALARWAASGIRAEALGHALVRAEVPFFCARPSRFGAHLEGAIDLLATDPGSDAALVVDYKTGDLGLSVEEVRARHAMQAEFYAGVLLDQGFERVECAFVCVERCDPAEAGEPLVVRYSYLR